MADHKPQPTLADYVAIVIAPVLIMALVGSLVFFLLEVLYVGQYAGRLQWIVFFFVFAAVLIARMSMMPGIAERAGLYGLLLAAAVLFALQTLVTYDEAGPIGKFNLVINIGLMVIIWWCAHRLTWDCTFIDDNVDASGKGLLEAAGLEAGSTSPAEQEMAEVDKDASSDPQDEAGLLGWWDRYRRYRENQRRQPHAPGVWIVYFSLAALPLFGLGQSLIPPAEEERRRYVFWLMGIYVGSGLGLLLTTSFLGLRRYLRQRKLQMPATMTGAWLTMGGILIAVLLLAGAFLPRPNPEYPLIDLKGPASSPDRTASNYAVLRDSPGQGEDRPGNQGVNDPNGGASGSGNKQGNQSQGQNKDNSGGGGQQGGSGSGQGQKGNNSGGSSQGNSGSGQGQKQAGGNQDKDQSAQPSSNNGGQSGQRSGQPGNHNGTNRSGQEASGGGSGSKTGNQKEGKPSKQNQDANKDGSDSASSSPPESSSLKSFFSGLAKLLKWIVFGLIALVVVFFVLRAFLKFLANFTTWAADLRASLRSFWQALFGWWKPTGVEEESAEAPAQRRQPRPFAAYPNPFASGSGPGSVEELVRYSFEALEAWGWEHGLGRQADDTPQEFAERVAEDMPALAADARRLAVFYARIAYARGRLPGSCTEALRQFWQRLEAVEDAPLSA